MGIGKFTTAAIVALMMVPAAAQAQEETGTTLLAGPAKLGSYGVTLQAHSRQETMHVTLTRRSGASRQTHSYELRGSVTLTNTADNGRGELIADFGADGGGRLVFEALRPARPDPVPKGCDGTPGTRRWGILKGLFRVRLGNTGFGVLRVRQIEGVLGQPPSFGCVNAGHTTGAFVTASRRVGQSRYFLDAVQVGRDIDIRYTFERPREYHEIVVSAEERGALRRPRNGAPGRLLGVGRWLSGEAYFRKRLLNGNLTAHFDFIGARRFPIARRDLVFGYAGSS